MTRVVSSLNAAQLALLGLRVVLMGQLDFASGSVYANDGLSDIPFGGNTFKAVADFGGVSQITEGVDIVSRAIQLTLFGGTASLLSTAQTEIYQNRNVVISLAVIDMASGLLVDTPEIAWQGRMDTMKIGADQGVANIILNCESRLRSQARIARFTDADQQMQSPGDTFFQVQTWIQNFVSQWGVSSAMFYAPALPPGQPPFSKPF